MAETTPQKMTRSQDLDYLEALLENLPDNLPLGSERYQFAGWAPDPDQVADYGEDGCLNRALEIGEDGSEEFEESGSDADSGVELESAEGIDSDSDEDEVDQRRDLWLHNRAAFEIEGDVNLAAPLLRDQLADKPFATPVVPAQIRGDASSSTPEDAETSIDMDWSY